MTALKRLAICCLLGWIAEQPVEAQTRNQRAALQLEPCTLPARAGRARCGSFEVWENRAALSGRKLKLRVVELLATGTPAAQPIVAFSGGPGEAAASSPQTWAFLLAAARRNHNILLVDQRGTADEHRLDCALSRTRTDLQQLDSLFSARWADACAKRHSATDLSLYSTAAAVDDVADVVRALGHRVVDVAGFSYGSRAALVFIERHRTLVRSAIIGSIAPVQINLPLVFASDAERALHRLVDSCRLQPDCKAAFPNLRAELNSVLQRFERGPVRARITHGRDTFDAAFGRTAFGYALRGMMYGELGRWIPLLLHRAHETGDFSWFANYFVSRSLWPWTNYPAALNLAVLCTEDVTRASADEKAVLAATAFGPGLFGQYQQACARLRVAGANTARATVRPDVPTLIFSGEFDPSTPLEYGTLVARDFPNSLHVVWKGGGHGTGDLDCRDALIAQLLRTGSIRNLDSSCVARSTAAAVHFPTSGEPPPPIAR